MDAPQQPQAADLLKNLVREIWVLTASDGTRRGGLTATWVNAASIDPARPVLLIGVAPNHFTAELIDRSGTFVAHLLNAQQQSLAMRFAMTSGRDSDKLADLSLTSTPSGQMRLVDCGSWFDCRVVARLATGDRNYYWGEVVAAGAALHGPPLTDHGFFQAATAEQRGQLWAHLRADLEIQRPAQSAWLAALPEWLRG